MTVLSFSDSDQRTLQDVVRWYRNNRLVLRHNDDPLQEAGDYPSPETYVCWVPTTGIPPTLAYGSTYRPGFRRCLIYKIVNTAGGTYYLERVTGFTQVVFNVSGSWVVGSQFRVINRTAYGRWVLDCGCSVAITGTGTTGTGSTGTGTTGTSTGSGTTGTAGTSTGTFTGTGPVPTGTGTFPGSSGVSCSHCTDNPMPATVTAVIPDPLDNCLSGDGCPTPGSYALPTVSDCKWNKVLSGQRICGEPEPTLQVQLVPVGGSIKVLLNLTAGGKDIQWEKTLGTAPTACRGSHLLSIPSSAQDDSECSYIGRTALVVI